MRFAIILAVITLSLAFAGEFTVTVPFSASDVEIREMANYTAVSIPGVAAISDIGAPALPAMNTRVALPAGTQATGVEVLSVSYQPLRGNYTVLPATEPVPLSLMGETSIPLPVPPT